MGLGIRQPRRPKGIRAASVWRRQQAAVRPLPGGGVHPQSAAACAVTQKDKSHAPMLKLLLLFSMLVCDLALISEYSAISVRLSVSE